MGNYTTVEGCFIIKPALRAVKIRSFKRYLDEHPRPAEITLQVEESQEETDDGYKVNIVSDILIPATSVPSKHYYLEQQLELIAKKFGSQHKFDGYLEIYPENPQEGPPYRLYIRGTKVIHVEPTVTWEEPPQ